MAGVLPQRQAHGGWDHSLVVAVVGPTASGKSALASDLARGCGGEIVNADAFALYRGMDLGTAKPSPQQQREIPHHCLDVLDVTEPASVAAYQRDARAAVEGIAERGHLPVVAGGSVLYLRALCDELDLPPRDPQVRDRLEREVAEVGPGVLHRRLAQADPVAAAQIDPRNVRRVVRALEVVTLTGHFAARLPQRTSWRPTLWLAPDWSREELDRRIELRVRRMWDDGLLAEVRRLLAAGLADSPTAARAVGYREALAVLAGDLTETDAVAATTRATRKLARRQERSFRQDPRIVWLDPSDARDRALQLVRDHACR